MPIARGRSARAENVWDNLNLPQQCIHCRQYLPPGKQDLSDSPYNCRKPCARMRAGRKAPGREISVWRRARATARSSSCNQPANQRYPTIRGQICEQHEHAWTHNVACYQKYILFFPATWPARAEDEVSASVIFRIWIFRNILTGISLPSYRLLSFKVLWFIIPHFNYIALSQ